MQQLLGPRGRSVPALHHHHRRPYCVPIEAGKSREYPTEPRIGIGVSVFRQWQSKLQILLIKRGKEPNKGQWCFPGGSLELGEEIAECAAREVLEETGVAVYNRTINTLSATTPLDRPAVFDAVDIIWKQDDGNYRFHYVIVEMVAVVMDPTQEPKAGDDAEAAQYFDLDELDTLPGLVDDCGRLAHKAAKMFNLEEAALHETPPV